MVAKVPLYHPDVQVTLFKTIKREQLDGGETKTSARFRALDQKIELRPFLSESTGLRTTKSVRDPAGGFSISLADKPYGGGLNTLASSNFETLYGLIEPMDFIEIRMRHAVVAGGGKPPVVMRGFVSEVQRSEAMTPDGKPIRVVTINGQDYGKLWQQMQIIYWPGYVLGQDVLSNFKLFARFGVGFQTSLKGSQLVKDVVEKIFNPYLQQLMPENTPNPKEIKTKTANDESTVDSVTGVTDITGPQNRDGSIYDLLRFYLDVGPWNELFLEDREDGVYVVFRPNPYKSVAGKKIQDGPDVPVVEIPATDVISMSVSRTDANVANYYWVRSPLFDLNSEIYRKQYAITGDKETMVLEDYQNSQSKLYGIRVMNSETMMGGDDVTTFKSGQTKEGEPKRDTSMSNWINERRRILVDQNKDNVVLERGSMRIRGNENVKAGVFIKLRRGTFTAEYYVSQVSHEYLPMQGFFSTLTVERGMGFVERAKREGGPSTPYLAELTETK